MATFLNRTVSMMSGDGPHNNRTVNALSPAQSKRSAGGPQTSDNSPLQIFVKAKKKINEIFGAIEDYVGEASECCKGAHDQSLIEGNVLTQTDGYREKVQGIRDVLARDHMKVAFFGRTSNGKSSVINAMLHDKILPSGIGHTTNCFLQVEGTPSDEPYLILEGSDKRCAVESVGQLAHALCKEKLNESQLVRVFWPKNRCILLRDDVVFVDSPGVDVTPNLDGWIDKHCLDADVFVLVANAESTLMVTEKNFFHKVSTRLSKPNIFVLNNRWDASANEPDFLDQVRKQHQERATDFLVKELKVCTQKEAEERIFFISAKEALLARLAEQGQSVNSSIADGFQSRYFEFQDFEKKFEECISKSAVKTKFEQHAERGRVIATELLGVFEKIYESAQQQRAEKLRQRQELTDRMEFIEKNLTKITQDMKQRIHNMVEDVEQRVSKALNEEIRRLSNLIDEFNRPFTPEPTTLCVYKKELLLYVERGLGSNLRSRLSTALALNIEANQTEMAKKVEELIPEQDRVAVTTSIIVPNRQPFEVFYRLNCDNVCSDFQEDLEFKFSWAPIAMVRRYYRTGSVVSTLMNREIDRYYTNGTVVPLTSPSEDTVERLPISSEDWSLISKVVTAAASSQGTMGMLLVSGFLVKTVGWRFIAFTGAVYTSLYMYERLTWTNAAKERTFKKQYVSYATRKLKMIVDLTSSNCSHQVQQELSACFSKLCHVVDQTITKMDSQIKEIQIQLHELERASSEAKVMKNKANFIINDLSLFEEAYLKHNN